jgi:tetratricopeptide (TPR) repeat protein
MKKPFIVVTFVACTAVVGLYSLPKGVLSNKDKQPKATAVAPEAKNSTDTHVTPLSPEQQKQVNALRASLAGISDKAARLKVINQLIVAYAKASRFDSAAYFAEEVAKLEPSLRNNLRAGDAYYGAFTYAIDESKANELALKTRAYYQKALDENPALLEAKSNMAMTYVSTDTPMQGIALLREVLEQDPDFEPALFNIGMLSMRSNQYQKAVERFRRILVNNPANTKAKFYLGVSLAEVGQKEEARQLLGEVAKQDQDPSIQAAVKEALQNL